jgi:hypothetical protein
MTAVVKSFTLPGLNQNVAVGTDLLSLLEKEALARKAVAIEISAISNARPYALERVLQNSGWPDLEPLGVLCETSYDLLSQARWAHYLKIPPRCEVFFWKDLTPEQRASLTSQAEERWFPAQVDPLFAEDRIEPSTSLGLSSGGQLVGWCVFQRMSLNRTGCVALFVREAFRGHGHALALAARSLHLHRGCPTRRIVFDVSLTNTQMMSFMRRGLMPYLESVQLIRRSRKTLRDPSSPVEEQ